MPRIQEAAPARPRLAAQQFEATKNRVEVVSILIGLLGRKLTAYVGGAKDTRAVDGWLRGGSVYKEGEPRLRGALRAAFILQGKPNPDPQLVQAWFLGLNPVLRDKSPARLLHEGDPEKVVPAIERAAVAFATGA